MAKRDDRADGQGRAFKGSQLQVQIYVNRRRSELEAAIRNSFPEFTVPDRALRWVSPLEADGFAEYRDSAFLKQLGLSELSDTLRGFWPKNGPVWDALAVVGPGAGSEKEGVLLVEGKSYPDEMHTTWDASDKSQGDIEAALDKTCTWLGIERTPAWTEGLYQLANRIAHLCFLREIASVPAWLALLLFTDDLHGPTSAEAWRPALEDAWHKLGLQRGVPHISEVTLPARGREELLARAVDVWGGLSN